MEHLRPWILAAALVVTPTLARGDDADPHDRFLQRASESGRLVLFVYTQPTTCPLAQGARVHMLSSPAATKSVRPHLVVAEIPIAKGGSRYKGYRRKFKGNIYPFWVIATPEGDFVDGGDYSTVGSAGQKGWVQRVVNVVAGHPPISQANRKKVAKMIEQARLDMENGEYGNALATAEKLKKVWFPKQLAADCKQLNDDVLQAGSKFLGEARALEQKKEYAQAALVYQRIVRQFTVKAAAGKQAKEKLQSLLANHPEIQEEFNKRKRDAQAKALLAKAETLEKRGALKSARIICTRVTRQYAGTPTAAEAGEAIERIDAALAAANPKQDSAKAEDPGEEEAQMLLRLARSYHVAKLDETAREKLLACIKKHPNTEAAKQAARLMAEWKLSPEQ